MKKAVFLDRDGVINQTIVRMGKPRAPYSLDEFQFIEGVKEAVAAFKAQGYLLIGVTNQPDVARGWVSKVHVDAVNEYVMQELKLDDLKVCFHTNIDQCDCRKPRPGMLLQAAHEFSIDMKRSFMIGDRLSDVEAGHRAGCAGILVGPGEDHEGGVVPQYQCANLLEASHWILKK